MNGFCNAATNPCAAGLVCDEANSQCDCDDYGDCVDNSVCTFDSCPTDDQCVNQGTLHGDVASPGSDPYLDPVCGPDGVVDDWDVAAVGNAFLGNIPAGCDVLNFD